MVQLFGNTSLDVKNTIDPIHHLGYKYRRFHSLVSPPFKYSDTGALLRLFADAITNTFRASLVYVALKSSWGRLGSGGIHNVP